MEFGLASLLCFGILATRHWLRRNSHRALPPLLLAVDEALMDFLTSGLLECNLPATFTVTQRHRAHQLAELFGLTHETFGETQRFIRLTRASATVDPTHLQDTLHAFYEREHLERLPRGFALLPPPDLPVSAAHMGAQSVSSPAAQSIAAAQALAVAAPGRAGFPAVCPQVTGFNHGWLFSANKAVLSELLGPDTRIIVELGSWLGKSVHFLAERAPNALIIAIDLWDNSYVSRELRAHYCQPGGSVPILNTVPLYETFLRNTWELRHRLLPLRMSTKDGIALVRTVLVRYGLSPDLV